jgi:hypothetical protein
MCMKGAPVVSNYVRRELHITYYFLNASNVYLAYVLLAVSEETIIKWIVIIKRRIIIHNLHFKDPLLNPLDIHSSCCEDPSHAAPATSSPWPNDKMLQSATSPPVTEDLISELFSIETAFSLSLAKKTFGGKVLSV